MGFMDLEACERVNKEALWQMLRIYDVDCKFLNGNMSMLML